MANVSINISKSNGTFISVTGEVDDLALEPFTVQLSTLLSTAANASATPPTTPPTA